MWLHFPLEISKRSNPVLVEPNHKYYSACTPGNYYVIVSNGLQTQCDFVQVMMVPCQSTLNLTCFVQAYYIGANTMQTVLLNQGEPYSLNACDTIDVKWHQAIWPHELFYAKRAVLNQDGTLTCDFPFANGAYYLAVKHRNSIESWSANPVLINTINNYDFSVAANQVYGDNQREVEAGIFAIYTGDINQDGYIDGFDYPEFDTDSQNNVSGVYVATDLNGDGYVDGFDYPIFDANSQNNVSVVTP
jgi:hypothetical protein